MKEKKRYTFKKGKLFYFIFQNWSPEPNDPEPEPGKDWISSTTLYCIYVIDIKKNWREDKVSVEINTLIWIQNYVDMDTDGVDYKKQYLRSHYLLKTYFFLSFLLSYVW